MAGADQGNSDLPSAVADVAGVPALPAPLGNLPSTASEELPAIIHRSGTNATFAAFGAFRN